MICVFLINYYLFLSLSFSDVECDGCIQMFEELEVLLPKEGKMDLSLPVKTCDSAQ